MGLKIFRPAGQKEIEHPASNRMKFESTIDFMRISHGSKVRLRKAYWRIREAEPGQRASQADQLLEKVRKMRIRDTAKEKIIKALTDDFEALDLECLAAAVSPKQAVPELGHCNNIQPPKSYEVVFEDFDTRIREGEGVDLGYQTFDQAKDSALGYLADLIERCQRTSRDIENANTFEEYMSSSSEHATSGAPDCWCEVCLLGDQRIRQLNGEC